MQAQRSPSGPFRCPHAGCPAALKRNSDRRRHLKEQHEQAEMCPHKCRQENPRGRQQKPRRRQQNQHMEVVHPESVDGPLDIPGSFQDKETVTQTTARAPKTLPAGAYEETTVLSTFITSVLPTATSHPTLLDTMTDSMPGFTYTRLNPDNNYFTSYLSKTSAIPDSYLPQHLPTLHRQPNIVPIDHHIGTQHSSYRVQRPVHLDMTSNQSPSSVVFDRSPAPSPDTPRFSTTFQNT